MHPLFVDWAVSSKCRLNCVHCRGVAGAELGTAEALHVVEEIAELGPNWLLLEGGEPFLREDLYEIVERARNCGLQVELVTNGQERMDLARLRAQEARVSVSLEATGSKYNMLRKGGSFEKLVENLERLKENELLGDLIFTFHSFSDFAGVIELAHRFECGVTVLGYKPREATDPLLPKRSEYGEKLKSLYSLAAKLGVRISSDEPFFNLVASSRPSAPIVPDVEGCIFGRYLFIDADGTVKPCTFSPFSIGHANDLRTVWSEWLQGSIFGEVSKRIRRGRCAECKFLAVCGGCRSRAAILTGDLLGEDPLCPV